MLGSLVATMGCAMCFPAAASIGAALGLGFLAQWEGLFVNHLLPLFAALALATNALAYLGHRQWRRSALGVLGPALVLLSLYPLWRYGFSTGLLYAGLLLMLAVGLWDLLRPARHSCALPSRAGNAATARVTAHPSAPEAMDRTGK